MSHADYSVGAFHSGNESKWSHDIGFEWGERAKLYHAVQRKPILIHIQPDAFLVEGIFGQMNLEQGFGSVEFCAGVFQPPCGIVCDYLERSTELVCASNVDGRNQGKGFVVVRLELQIPSFKIGTVFCCAMIILLHKITHFSMPVNDEVIS